jgi:hypothetical protein
MDMRRLVLVVCVLAGIIVGLRLAAPSLAHGGSPTPAATTLAFAVAFRDTVLAANTSDLSPGDRILLSDRLLQNGKEIGHDAGVCTVTDAAAGGEALCAVTWALPEGTISAQFLNAPPPEKIFAVVGGTGQYQGARGYGVLVEEPNQTGTVTFHLRDDSA